jgi:predicted solute-binding protein
LKRLDLKHARPMQMPPKQHTVTPIVPATPMQSESLQVHIKEFKEQKQPRSAIEMAAIVAYYLANMAPEANRKESIATADLDTYFKIARFKLPAKQKFTLVNAMGTRALSEL